MELKTLKAKNFLSFSDISLSLEQELCLIDGFNYDDNNSNGAGKTAIMDAITYCLFGEIPRSIKVSEISNRYKTGPCLVELLINCNNKDITIVRSRNPTDLYMITNGAEKRGKDIKDTQTMIEEFLSIDLRIFLNSVYFNQNNHMQFVTASDLDKKKILTDLLDLEIFDKAYVYSHEIVKQLQEDINILQSKHEICIKNAALIEQELQDFKQKSDNFEEDRNNRIITLRHEVAALNSNIEQMLLDIGQKEQEIIQNLDIDQKLQQLNEQLIQLDELNNNINKLEYLKQSIIDARKFIENRIKSFKNLENTNCSLCNQPVNEIHVAVEMKNLHNDLALNTKDYEEIVSNLDNLVQNKSVLLNVKKDIDKLQLKQKELSNVENEILRLKDNIKYKQDMVAKHNNDIVKLHDMSNIFNDIIKNKIKIKEDNQNEIDNLKCALQSKDMKLQQYIIMKDSYSKIKYYVFENIVDELNSNIDKYLQPLFDSDISITFLTQMENNKGEVKQKFNTSIMKGCKTCSFNSLSDGEKRRVEIATNFALSDIVSNRSKNSFNIMFLDEILSGALSKDGAERVVELLKTLKGDKHIFIVDHNNFVQDLIDNKIFVEKRDNISKIVDIL